MRLRLPYLYHSLFFTRVLFFFSSTFNVVLTTFPAVCIETSWKLEKFPLVSRENSRRWLPDKKRHAVEMQISIPFVETLKNNLHFFAFGLYIIRSFTFASSPSRSIIALFKFVRQSDASF